MRLVGARAACGRARWRALALALALIAPAEAADPDLLDQKARLFEALLASPRMAALPANERDTLGSLLQAARQALEAGHLGEAQRLLDEGLKRASKAATGAREARAEPEAERARYRVLLARLASLRRWLESGPTEAADGGRLAAVAARLDRLEAEADSEAHAGRFTAALARLEQAYRAAVVTLAEVTAGKTVVRKLDFATPEDEVAYERERYRSYRMLIEGLLADTAGDPAVKGLVRRYRDEAAQLFAEAEARAAAGDAAAAIALMERASGRLGAALGLGGFALVR